MNKRQKAVPYSSLGAIVAAMVGRTEDSLLRLFDNTPGSGTGNCKNRYRIVSRTKEGTKSGGYRNATRVELIPSSKYNPRECFSEGKR